MKLIVGLGNPGKTYENTRHNVGFTVIDELAKHPEITSVEKGTLEFGLENKFKAEIAQTEAMGEKIILAKPQTFVNLSGESVSKIKSFYKIHPKDIWTISDDFEIPLGTIRVRLEGSSGGHNGLESLINSLSDDKFVRIRIGIGEARSSSAHKEFEDMNDQPAFEAKDFVLGKFNDRETAIINKVSKAAAIIIIEGIKANRIEAHTIEVD